MNRTGVSVFVGTQILALAVLLVGLGSGSGARADGIASPTSLDPAKRLANDLDLAAKFQQAPGSPPPPHRVGPGRRWFDPTGKRMTWLTYPRALTDEGLLCSLSTLSRFVRSPAGTTITRPLCLLTAGRTELVATYHVDLKPGREYPRPAVVLLHSVHQTELYLLPRMLAEGGAVLLRPHLRGSGFSIGRGCSAPRTAEGLCGFDPKGMAAMVHDVETAVSWLQKRPEVDSARVYVVGIGLGATLAYHAARLLPQVAGAVAISPVPIELPSQRLPKARRRRSAPVVMLVSSPRISRPYDREITWAKALASLNPAVRVTTIKSHLREEGLLSEVPAALRVVRRWVSLALAGQAAASRPSPAGSPAPTSGPTSRPLRRPTP